VRRLLLLAAPIIATMVSRMAMGFTDFVVISRLGTEATAAASPSTMLLFTFLCVGMGIAGSTTTFVSQALGRGRPHDAPGYAWQTVYLGGLMLLLAYPVGLLFEPFWRMVGHPPAVQAMEIVYCRTAVWCVGFATICAGFDGFFNGIQRPGVGFSNPRKEPLELL